VTGTGSRKLDGEATWGGLEILEGPCCDEMTCEVRELWPYPSETVEDMKARLRAKYGWLQPRKGGHLWS
jgi:hypothetical protein